MSPAPGRPGRPTLRERSRGLPERVTRLRVRASLRRDPAPPPLDASLTLPSEPLETLCIVFSKDRAMQLDACLRSIERHAPYAGEIVVIYTASGPDFAEGYRRLEVSERVRLVAETDFQTDVLRELGAAGEHVVFHTDDDIFFRSPPAAPFVPDGYAAFSLRLGRNTTYCYTADTAQRLPGFAATEPLLAWDWRRAELDFGYPLSLNGHVFRTELIRRLLEGARVPNPNELEHRLNQRRHLAPPGLLAYGQSSTVCVPANLVQAEFANRFGSDDGLSTEALNRRFLAGERIDLDAIDYSSVNAAHCELGLAFATPVAPGS